MLPSKMMKSAKLGIALQLTEVTPSGLKGRLWEVHDVERNRGFRVTLLSSVVEGFSRNGPSRGKPVVEEVIEGAIGLAIERALLTPPEKVAGPLYDLAVLDGDFQEYVEVRK